jgi:hypothetical protein
MIALPLILTGIVCWLEATSAINIALVISAIFYGMWLEQRVWQPCVRKREAGRSGGKPEQPLPLSGNEAPDATNNLGK